MSAQSISRGRIVNHLSFGKSLQKLAHDLLSPFIAKVDYGFQDGGCFMFATALRDWSEGVLTLVSVYRTDRTPDAAQHVLACLDGTLYLDSDGVGTGADVLHKMAAFNAMPEAEIREHKLAEGQVIPFDPELCAFLAKRMRRRFGPFNASVFG